ncbi:MAG TPA: PEP-CTERM sorting domain-containing protein [Rhodocyclaceae bacterium]|nr:PEP-CTERM sorting domain-containing protein [Rhodocyclaceae bacterium]
MKSRAIHHISLVVAFLAVALMGEGVAQAQVVMAPGSFASGAAPAATINDPTANIIDTDAWTPVVGVNNIASQPSTFSGQGGSWVIQGDSANPFGPNGLTFLYQFKNDSTSTDAINRLTVSGFGSYQTAVAVNTAWASSPVSQFTRSLTGNSIGATFDGLGLAPGNYGNMVVYTDATGYGYGSALVQDGSQGSWQVFAPIPEPETYAMLMAGLGLMGVIARRRKAQQ